MAEQPRSTEITRRKDEHLDICINADSYAVETGSTMMDGVKLIHRALPGINENDVDTRAEFLDARINLPVFISSMTGGSDHGFRVNKDLARVAAEAGIPVGTGSIRVLFRHPDLIEHFHIKKIARDVPVFANIGGVQLRQPGGSGIPQLVELLKRLEVDGIAVHLNPGQELVQPEGDREFAGILDGISALCDASPVPVMVKETGFGIAPDEIGALLSAGVRYVDLAGAGGSNWVTVEGHRLDEPARAVTDAFAEWGVPTAAALRAAQMAGHTGTGRILASGGIRNGVDVAKCLAMGAMTAGLALPFVRAVTSRGVEGGLELVEQVGAAFRTAMVLTGSRTVGDLRRAPVITSGELERVATGLAGLDRI